MHVCMHMYKRTKCNYKYLKRKPDKTINNIIIAIAVIDSNMHAQIQTKYINAHICTKQTRAPYVKTYKNINKHEYI